ncbi:agmatine deiminase [Lentilactobacillus kisonensis DSM 19906 = JCM 15041]|uniref:Putative agmatine deiminase n=1 Tax=Lentilactobacillus kisonensis DSM 19906 = JCM 15041 TaxID=1423766 RepID=A0A0R1NZJ9_9LACO|nr:agmatine deiminase [Lentilactobacillus kisonensis DSM 19906 = JCM 15041]
MISLQTLQSNPKQDGFRMPAEFEPHQGVYMLWPTRPDNWRNGAKPAQRTFANVAKAIAQFEHVTVGVADDQYVNARHLLPAEVEVVELSSNDAWVRDCGPTIVTNQAGERRGIDWHFNAWGGLVDGLYFPWDKDDRVAQKITELEHLDRYRLDDFVLEGGAIHVDGEGTLITTEECLLSKGRNPELSKSQIENLLKEYLNVSKVIWLKHGIYLDETNGHVDNIANFVRPGVVALAWTDDQSDPQYQISKENEAILRQATDAKGRPIRIERLTVPQPITITKAESEGVDAVAGTLPRRAGDRLAASYVNYYTANGGIVFPMFGDLNDQKAQATLQRLYPDRKIVGVYAREIILGGGNIHCVTQQIPE